MKSLIAYMTQNLFWLFKFLTRLWLSLKSKIWRTKRRLYYVIGFIVGSVALEDVVFFGGIALLGVGAGLQFGTPVGLMVSGLLLVLFIRPIKNWYARDQKKD